MQPKPKILGYEDVNAQEMNTKAKQLIEATQAKIIDDCRVGETGVNMNLALIVAENVYGSLLMNIKAAEEPSCDELVETSLSAVAEELGYAIFPTEKVEKL